MAIIPAIPNSSPSPAGSGPLPPLSSFVGAQADQGTETNPGDNTSQINSNLDGTLSQFRQNQTQTENDWKAGNISMPHALFQTIGNVLGGVFSVPGDLAGPTVRQAVGDDNVNKAEDAVSNTIDVAAAPLADILSKPEVATYQNAGSLYQKAGDLLQQSHAATDPTQRQRLVQLAQNMMKVANSVKGNADSIDNSLATAGEDVNAAANIGTAALGGKNIDAVSDAVKTVAGNVKSGVTAVKGMFSRAPEALRASNVQTAIDAVNPNLSGKGLLKAYRDAALGKRRIEPAGIFNEQGLTPSAQAINHGTRLANDLPLSDGTVSKGIKFSPDPVKNLDSLGDALGETEDKLTPALQGDMEVNYNADKPGLVEKIDQLAPKMPREFSEIKDSKTMFKNVLGYVKGLIEKADDSIIGLRKMNSKFHSQAKLEYPNAFRDDAIDVKTPAGRAIKDVGDVISKHLYESAPNGSDIQKLIGREADIFKGIDSVVPKAAAGDGKNLIEQIIKKHPTLSKYVGMGLDMVGAGKILKIVD